MSKYVVKIISTLENGYYSNGTGFLCSTDGHILTCAHNVIHSTLCNVYYNKAIYESKIIAIDNRIDVAILKIDLKTEYPKIAMIAQYGKCFTYGYHHDQVCLSYQEGSIMTLNYVSNHAIDSTLTTVKGYQGASGSPIYNENYEVIGLFSYESSIGSGGIVVRLLQSFLNIVNYASTPLQIKKSHLGLLTKSIGIDTVLRNNIIPLKSNVRGEKVTHIENKGSQIAINDIILSINNNVVGRGYISSESYVLYMPKNTLVKIEYLKFKEKYKRYTCKLKLTEFPSKYDKPLDDTTILKLSF